MKERRREMDRGEREKKREEKGDEERGYAVTERALEMQKSQGIGNGVEQRGWNRGEIEKQRGAREVMKRRREGGER
jgi:hypothetical protein